MLPDFFRINLPYGIAKNAKNEWIAFNREHLPLGYNDPVLKAMPGEDYLDLPVYTSYSGLTEKMLKELADGNQYNIKSNDRGEIITIYLYNDGTNPVNHPENLQLWDNYFKKLKVLSTLQSKNLRYQG